MSMPTDRESVLRQVAETLQEHLPNVRGCAIIGDGININFENSALWWRFELRDITELLAQAFRRD